MISYSYCIIQSVMSQNVSRGMWYPTKPKAELDILPQNTILRYHTMPNAITGLSHPFMPAWYIETPCSHSIMYYRSASLHQIIQSSIVLRTNARTYERGRDFIYLFIYLHYLHRLDSKKFITIGATCYPHAIARFEYDVVAWDFPCT